MEKERSAIVELFQKGKKQNEIMKLLKIPQTRQNFVIRTIKRFNETGGVMNRARTGRLVSITTVKVRKIVRSRVWRNPQRSIRKMAKELKISRDLFKRLSRDT
ncbi:hypothetical protein LOD99_9503 [Oopsacas minuta]|uniref:Uncharacterized protein n=1 Tax=Oopsacas minuta TaxID=111878 RepID=A0AAV7JC70_9METZ|nr:hypothetical protein LOD99_9503 [Oopsacas minuta]